MIKRLRKRFILSAILSVFVVLFLIIGGINLFNYMDPRDFRVVPT